jgi:hypothetical protein
MAELRWHFFRHAVLAVLMIFCLCLVIVYPQLILNVSGLRLYLNATDITY